MLTKREIEFLINEGKNDNALTAIEEYERSFPNDADILSLKTGLYLNIGEIDKAHTYAKEAVKRIPLNAEFQYNYAVLCEAIGDYYEAYRAYKRSAYLFAYYQDPRKEELNPNAKSEDVLNKILEIARKPSLTLEEAQSINSFISAIESMEKTAFGLNEYVYRSHQAEMIGTWIYDDFNSGKYFGVFKDQYLAATGVRLYNDLVRTKGELLSAKRCAEYIVEGGTKEYIVPIAMERNGYIMFKTKEDSYSVPDYNPYSFNYYKVQNGTVITGSGDLIVGSPVPIKMDKNKKKLVLSIFVDGLSYSILKGENFKKNMPYTYEYFKEGLVFENAINTGEWTYPSIASYVCSLDTTHHMLFHHTLEYPMPEDVPTIAETFHDAGYYTSKYCGNWRIIPGYGHDRGYDRFVYQHQLVGFKVHEVVSDAINQIEAGKELNQYMWISIGDLHDIADKTKLPFSVQRDIPLKNRVYHETGATSVKQKYSYDDKLAYTKMAKHIDGWLHILFQYIEENYNSEEVVVSLFSDHGQGYLIEREDAHFLSAERSNVPMMFKGGLATGKGYCEEVVSALDYANILRKVSGLEDISVTTDGNLPEIFGGKRREYAYTESIHPGDPYQAAIFSPDKSVVFFFCSDEQVLEDGRFWLKNYNYWLEDMSGNRLSDDEKEKYFLRIVMDHIAPILMYE